MIKNINQNIKFICINSIIFFLSILSLELNAETKIIAKSGDTLLKISKQYGVPLKELMYKNNFNDASKVIEGELILIPLKSNYNDSKNENLTHKVVQGDTLYKIARNYNVNIKDIILINNLSIDSYLNINQVIILPKDANYKKSNSQKDFRYASKKIFFHKTSKAEDLSTIAKMHKISIDEINILNETNFPIKINPNVKLKLRKSEPSKWLKYGSIIINWSDWTYFDGNYITQAKTKKNKEFYLAVSCKQRALNNTLNNSYWTTWYFPEIDFEFELINDFCNKNFNF